MRLGFAIYSIRLESSDGDVIHNLLHFFQVILQRIKLLSQAIVLEVEKPETSRHVREELGDGKGTTVITKNDTVHCQSRLHIERILRKTQYYNIIEVQHLAHFTIFTSNKCDTESAPIYLL